jgi:hypothetical protein
MLDAQISSLGNFYWVENRKNFGRKLIRVTFGDKTEVSHPFGR